MARSIAPSLPHALNHALDLVSAPESRLIADRLIDLRRRGYDATDIMRLLNREPGERMTAKEPPPPMRTSQHPCKGCGCIWQEPKAVKRGPAARMEVLCPGCRVKDQRALLGAKWGIVEGEANAG